MSQEQYISCEEVKRKSSTTRYIDRKQLCRITPAMVIFSCSARWTAANTDTELPREWPNLRWENTTYIEQDDPLGVDQKHLDQVFYHTHGGSFHIGFGEWLSAISETSNSCTCSTHILDNRSKPHCRMLVVRESTKTISYHFINSVQSSTVD